MNPSLKGKSIVVIGGTTGLGLSAAHALLAEGARLVVVGRDPANVRNARSALGANARAITGDATNPATSARAIRLAQRVHGGFHGLYHVAGGSGRRFGDGPLHTLTDEGWDKTLQLNLTSLFYSNRAAIRAFLDAGQGGCILNMGSVLSFSPSPAFFATHAYSSAKAAIVGLSTAAAAHYAPHNIRVNVIAPALVTTPMSRRAQADQDILAFIRTKQPLDGGRIGDPTDLDAAATFLLSDGARFVTGQVLCVDGGWSVTEGQHPLDPNRV